MSVYPGMCMITCVCVSRYVYNYLGGKHDTVWDEAIATLCTFGITVLWLGPCQVVFIWAFFNCFGLNFELWTAKFVCMEPFASLEVRESNASRYLQTSNHCAIAS